MAFVQAPIDPNQQNQFAPQGQTTPNPLALLPPQAAQTGGSAGQGGGPAGGPPSVGSPTQFGSTASRLGDYLQANQDQVQQMANQIAGNFNTQNTGIQQSINQAGQNFGGQVQSGYTPLDQGLVGQVQSNPTGVAGNPQQVSEFQSMLGDQYTGPTSFEGSAPYAQIQQNVQNAIQQAGLLGNYSGLSGYLQNNVEQNATPGQNTLDTVLLYGNQPAYQTVTGAANQANALPGQLSGVASAQDQAVQQAEQAAPAAQQAAQQALTGTESNIANALQGELGQAQNAFQTYNTDVGQLSSSAQNINSAIQQYLAANPNITVTGGQDFLAPWANLQADTTAPTINSVANPQDFANLAALQALGGNLYQVPSPLDQTQSGQAGSFALPQDLQSAIANQAVPQAMTNELQGIQGQIMGPYNQYQGLMNQEQQRAALVTQSNDVLSQIQALQHSVPAGGQMTPDQAAQLQSLQQQYQTITTNPLYQIPNLWPQIEQEAQSIQWVPQAANQYNSLLTQLQADMSGLGNLSVPNYAQPSAAPTLAQQAGNAAGVGAGTAAGVAGALPASQALALENPLATSLGPAAVAGYGTANIVQNAMANPVASGLGILGNTMTLGALSLPPNILSSIGNDITGVMNDIGSFFGGLF